MDKEELLTVLKRTMRLFGNQMSASQLRDIITMATLDEKKEKQYAGN